MLHTAPALMANNTAYSALLVIASKELSPARIRQSIADLVGQNRLAEADLLSYEALQRFPQSEDILVMRSLVAQVRHDWSAAHDALEKLVQIQGHATQAVTWVQWVRVLRCLGDEERARTVAAQGLASHPHHPQLLDAFSATQTSQVRPARKAA